METKILVTYASKHGATAEIAKKIGEVLAQAGMQADVQPVEKVRDVTPYQAVVLGSAVYVGQWQKSALKFLQAHEAALTERTVWLFSSGPTGEGEPVELLKGWRFPEKHQPLADRIGPREIAVFGGALNEQDMGFFEKWVIKNVKAPTGDFRDWEAITAWAEGIAAEVKEETLAQNMP